MALEPGATVTGSVAKLLKYGVIINLPDGDSGLVHISEIADEYVQEVSDYFREGEEVQVKIIGTRGEGRYDLSIKQIAPRKPIEGAPARPAARPGGGGGGGGSSSSGGSFEERLTDFLKDSNRKQNELKRSREGRRRGRR